MSGESDIQFTTNIGSLKNEILSGLESIEADLASFSSGAGAANPAGGMVERLTADINRLKLEGKRSLEELRAQFDQAARSAGPGQPFQAPGDGRSFGAQATTIVADVTKAIEEIAAKIPAELRAELPQLASTIASETEHTVGALRQVYVELRAGLAQITAAAGLGVRNVVGSQQIDRATEPILDRLGAAAGVGGGGSQPPRPPAPPTPPPVGDGREPDPEKLAQALGAQAAASEEATAAARKLTLAEEEAARRTAESTQILPTPAEAQRLAELRVAGAQRVGSNYVLPGFRDPVSGSASFKPVNEPIPNTGGDGVPPEMRRVLQRITDYDQFSNIERQAKGSPALTEAADRRLTNAADREIAQRDAAAQKQGVMETQAERLMQADLDARARATAQREAATQKQGALEAQASRLMETDFQRRQRLAQQAGNLETAAQTENRQRDLGAALFDQRQSGEATRVGRTSTYEITDPADATRRIMVERAAAGAKEITDVNRLADAERSLAADLKRQEHKPTTFFGGVASGFTSKGFDHSDTESRFDVGSTLGNLGATAGNLLKYGALGAALYSVTGAIADTKKETLDYIDSLTNLQVRLGSTTAVTASYTNQIEELSRLAGSNVGAELDAIARSVSAFGNATPGKNDTAAQLREIGQEGATAASRISVIAGIDLTDATNGMIAVATAFDIGAGSLNQVEDAIANAKRLGGDSKDIVEGLSQMAGAAKEAGFNVQEAANAVSLVAARNNESGATAATRLSRILAMLNGSAAQNALRSVGVDTNRTVKDQLDQLGQLFDDNALTKAQQQNVIHAVGGAANSRELLPFLTEHKRLVDALEQSYEHAGAGAAEFNRKNNDLAGLFRKITGDLTNIQINLVRSGIFDGIGAGLKLIEPGLRTIADLLGYVDRLVALVPGGRAFAGVLVDTAVALKLLKELQLSTGLSNIAGLFMGGTKTVPKGGKAAVVEAGATVATAGTTVADQRRAAALAELTALTNAETVADERRAAALSELTALSVGETVADQRRAAALIELTALTNANTAATVENNLAQDAGAVTGPRAGVLRRSGNFLKDGIGNVGDLLGPVGVKVIAGFAAITALDSIMHAFGDAATAAAKGVHDTATALKELDAASDPAGLSKAADSFQAAAGTTKLPKMGVKDYLLGPFSSRTDAHIMDWLGRVPGLPAGRSAADRSDSDLGAAKILREQSSALDKALADATARGSAAAFGGDATSLQNVTDGLQRLTDSGASAAKIIAALNGALGDTAKLGPGQIAPGGGPVLGAKIAADFVPTVRKALQDYIVGKGGTSRNDARHVADADINDLLPATADPKKRAELQGKVSDTINNYIKSVGLEDGGQLTPTQMTELANKLAELYVNPKQSKEGQAKTRALLAAKLQDFLNQGTDPGSLMIDQQTADKVQQILVQQASTHQQQMLLQTGDKVAAARQKLADIKQAEALVLSKGKIVDDTTILAELQAEKDVQDALSARADSADALAKSQISVDDAVGRAAADAATSLRHYNDALAAGDVEGANTALAQYNEQQQQTAKLVTDAANSQTVSGTAGMVNGKFTVTGGVDPRDKVGQAAAAVATAANTLNHTTQYGADGKQTKAFGDALTAYRNAVAGSVSAQVDEANALAAANVAVGDKVGELIAQQNAELYLAANTIGSVQAGHKRAAAALAVQINQTALAGQLAGMKAQLDPRDVTGAAALDAAGAFAYYLSVPSADKQAKGDALARSKAADLASKQADQARDSAKKSAAVDPASQLDKATDDLRLAQENVDAQKVGQKAYYDALRNLREKQYALGQAELAYADSVRRLKIDLTDPVQVAEADLQRAKAKLAKDVADKRKPDVIAADQLDVKSAETARESAAFSQRLSDLQTNEQLGRITHAQFMSGMQSEHNRLTARLAMMKQTDNGYRQTLDELNQVDQAMKAASDAMSSQFNLGDITIPTPYQVRSQLAGEAAAASGNSTQYLQTVNVQITTNDPAAMNAVLQRHLGPQAFQRASVGTAKV